ncbi:MAG: hypothetical protein RMK30_03940 [Anaerolineae bacterium]|nr:hypothetical protein [Anaerolineae bacterium]MDW8102010.1 hypothetical protein [Anaerolineae bacterium]
MKEFIRKALRTAGEILYGMTVYDMVVELRKQIGAMENFFIFITFGDLLGVPILPTYYSLRIFPYLLPKIGTWKKSALREREFTELLAEEIG